MRRSAAVALLVLSGVVPVLAAGRHLEISWSTFACCIAYPTNNLPPFAGTYREDGLTDIAGGRKRLLIGNWGWSVKDGDRSWTGCIESLGDLRNAGTYNVQHSGYPACHLCGTITSSGYVNDNPVDYCQPQKNDPHATAGDPFNVLSGNVFRDETDVCIPQRGVPLAVGRAYNSGTANRACGLGWAISLEWRLFPPSTARPLQVVVPDGRCFTFAASGSDWTCRRDLRLRVRPAPQNEWTLDAVDDGSSLRFDSGGRWKWTDDGWGNRLTATTRNSEGKLTCVTHSSGDYLVLNWSGSGDHARLTSIVDQDGHLWADYTYGATTYTGHSLLTQCRKYGAAGGTNSTSYAHDRQNANLLGLTNAMGGTLTYSYASAVDTALRCTGSALDGNQLSANPTWDVASRRVCLAFPVAANSNRYETVTWRSDVPRIDMIAQGGETLTYSYDETTLEPTSRVWQAGTQIAASRTVLDALGRATNASFALGSGTPANWRTEWHATLDLPLAKIDPLGWRTECTWTNGLVAGIQATNGLGGWISSSLVWSQGLLSAVSDPLGRTTRLSYDTHGCLTAREPPAGPVLTCSNDVLGNPVWFRLPDADNGERLWQVERDGFGRATRVTDPEGLDTHHAFDLLGHMTASVDRAGRQTFYSHGTGGRVLALVRAVADGGTNRSVTLAMDYDLQMEPAAIRDSLGRTVEAWTPDAAGRVAGVTNVEGRVASVTYGVLGLPQAVNRFDGTSVTFSYNTAAQLSAQVFPGHTLQFAWLANGLPAVAADGTTTITNEWIAPGRLTAQETRTTDWTSRVEYRHDLAGTVTQTLASAIEFAQNTCHDAGGRETNRVDTCHGAAVTTAREYADWNGLPSVVTSGPLEQHFGWDRLDRLTNLTWQVSGATVHGIAYRHDLLGRITQRVDRMAGVDVVRNYSYDDLDRLIAETHSTGFTAEYSFDDVGRRTTKATPHFDVAYVNGMGDRLAGWDVTRTNLPSIDVTGYATEPIGTDAHFGVRQVYNAASDVTPTIDGVNFSATLQPGPLGTQSVVAVISDAAGNAGLATNTFVLTAYTAGDYLADAAGCVTQMVYRGPACRQERTLTWDSQYRLTSVATNGIPAESYGYDPYGRRIWTAAGGVTNRHVQNGEHVLADLDATGGVLRTYLYGPSVDELIAMTVHTGGVAQTYYAIRDHQHTIWAWVDESGVTVERHDYDAWGRVLAVHDRSALPIPRSALGNRFLFQGREYSWATGLYQFRARWYDPVTGRWLSNDPIGISGGLNQYVFAGNDPANFTDPFGLQTDDYSMNALGLNSADEFSEFMRNGDPSIGGPPQGGLGGSGGGFRGPNAGKVSNGSPRAQPIPKPQVYPEGTSGRSGVPQKAIDVSSYVGAKGNAPPGYKGGRSYENDGRGGGQVLPTKDPQGNPVTYREFDVNPYQKGVGRGGERVVVGSDGNAYYTSTHYDTFTPIK